MDRVETAEYHPLAMDAPTTDIQQRIAKLVASDKVVLFMKGTRAGPQCGFSATVVGLLDQYLPDYATVNVLADPEVRDGVKEFANWPTIPQLYVNGEFVGGCDIIRQLDEDGELVKALGDAVRLPDPPRLTITDAAAAVFKQAVADAEGDEILRLAIDAEFRHDLALDTPRASDVRTRSNGIDLICDPASARRANGLEIDYVSEPQEGFKMENPNAPAQVKQISCADAKALVAQDGVRFIDVRTPRERQLAMLEGTTLLEPESMEALLSLDKDTPIVFHCHHGHRSFQAAIHFLEQGFTRLYNVVGGIDAWSQEVDSSIPRY